MQLNPTVEYKHISEWIGTLIDLKLTPRQFARQLSTHLNKYYPVKVKVYHTDSQLDPGDFTIAAEYDPSLDENDQLHFFIDLIINHPNHIPMTITHDFADRFIIEMVESMVHEHQHQHQYRSRGHITNRCYTSHHMDSKIRKDQEYLGKPDEIDAFAANIAARFFLLEDKLNTIKPIESLDLKQYYLIFGPQHKVVKRLLKKIVVNTYYLKENHNDQAHI
jgi:hypothetical protein